MPSLTRRRLLAALPALALPALARPRGLAAALPGAGEPNGDSIGALGVHVTGREETLLDVARRYDLGFVELRAANPGIDVWLPGAQTYLLLPGLHLLPQAPRQGIVINLAEMRLYYFPPGAAVETHPIGIGRDGRLTPLGETKVVRKTANPTWHPPQSIRAEKPWLPAAVPPGPDNPLGAFTLYLGWPAYLIHGTNLPDGVGRRVSSGCVRMYPEDIAALYPKVKPGTPVTVVDQPVKLGWIDGDLHIEVHPTQAQADRMEVEGHFGRAEPLDATPLVRAAAGDFAAAVDWDTVRKALVQRRGVPLRITARLQASRSPE
jgi:L,D-transpeptidase ErfK/SrfK